MNDDILSIPGKGTINFHNAPPSRYHGINIPSWVIINGEKSHGVMWHFVDGTIDTGDVIISEEFPLSKSETAASLTAKCMNKGIGLFPPVIRQLMSDNIERTPQQKNSSY